MLPSPVANMSSIIQKARTTFWGCGHRINCLSLHNYHPACCLEIISLERVEVNSVGDHFAGLVFAVPIRCLPLVNIVTGFLYPQIQLANKLSVDIVDANGHCRVGC